VKGLLSSTLNLPRAILGACMVAIPIAVFWWYYRRETRRTAESLAVINPTLLSFTADGLHTKEKSGATTFLPWSSFDGFREGRTVILLEEAPSHSRRMIPIDSLSPDEVQRIRDLVRSHLPKRN
jgi:hypothetical protein